MFRYSTASLLPAASRVGSPAASLVWADLASHRHRRSLGPAAVQAPFVPFVTTTLPEESVEARETELMPPDWSSPDGFLDNELAHERLKQINSTIEDLMAAMKDVEPLLEQQQALDAMLQQDSQLYRAAVEHEGGEEAGNPYFLTATDKAIMKAHVPAIRKERKEEEKQWKAEKAARRAAMRALRRGTEAAMAPTSSIASPADAAAARQLRRDQRRAGGTGSSSAARAAAVDAPTAPLEPLPTTSNRGGPAGPSTPAAYDAIEDSLAASVDGAALAADLAARAALEASLALPVLDAPPTTATDADTSMPTTSNRLASVQAARGALAMPLAPSVVPLSLAPLAPSQMVVQQRRMGSTRRARSPRRSARASTMEDVGTGALQARQGALATLMIDTQRKNNLLSAEEERELAIVVKDLLELEAKQVQLAQELQRQPTAEEWCSAVGMSDLRLFEARLAAGRQAKNAMVQRNLRLVLAVSKKFANRGMAISDLVSEGIAGLLKGVEKFDGSKGFKFSTYAHWWIRQAVGRSVSDQGRMVRLPVHLHEAWAKIRKADKALEAELGRKPAHWEVAAKLGWDEERLSEMYDAVRQPESMEAAVFGEEDGGATIADVLEDEHHLTPDEQASADNVQRDIEAMLCELNEREAGVIRMRFGLVDGIEHTLDDIGSKYKVTRERIRQIESKALRRLRALQTSGQGRLSEYLFGDLEDKSLAARNSRGLKKSS